MRKKIFYRFHLDSNNNKSTLITITTNHKIPQIKILTETHQNNLDSQIFHKNC